MQYTDFWALIDCNNFYVSCQQLFEPKYIGKPCVVLSNNDGCVVSRSDEAKAMGIQMGEVYFLNKQKFEEMGVKVWSSNYPLYGDLSSRVMELLAQECLEIQVYSIDECFAKFRCFNNHADPNFNMLDFFEKLRAKILKWFGIPVCIGVAPTKALSKVANRIAKKFKKHTGGVHIIENEELRIKALKWLQVEDIWGIGRQHTAKLKRFNINTAYDFTQQHEDWIRRTFSVVELRLMRDLKGLTSLDFEEVKAKKGINCGRSFDKGLTTIDEVAERLTSNVCHAAEKLRSQNDHCKSVTVYLTTGSHTEQPYSRTFRIKLPFATNSNLELTKFALYALRIIFKDGYVYRKCGVYLTDFVPASGEQLSMFNNRDVRHDVLMKVMDGLNFKHSKRVVQLAIEPKVKFEMRQEFMSPSWTTRISDIPVAKSG